MRLCLWSLMLCCVLIVMMVEVREALHSILQIPLLLHGLTLREFTQVLIRMTLNGLGVTIGAVYGPPSSDIPLFIESCENLLLDIILDTDKIKI